MSESQKVKNKIISFIILALSLIITGFLFRNIDWLGSSVLHSNLELTYAYLSIFLSIFGLIQYYNFKNNVTLLVGCGYAGTAILSLFDAFSTSNLFSHLLPSGHSALIFWNNYFITIFLDIFLFLAFLVGYRESKFKVNKKINERFIYAASILLILVYFQIISFIPLPSPYFAKGFISQPLQLIPAIIIFTTLVGYIASNRWKTNELGYWFVLSLIVSFAVQAFYLPFSKQLLDTTSISALVLNLFGASFLLIGVLVNVYNLYKHEKYNEKRIISILNNMIDGVITVDKNCYIQSCNPAMEYMFKYPSSEIIGTKISTLIPHECTAKNINLCKNCFINKCTNEVHDVKARKKDGKEFPVEIDLSEINVEEETLLMIVIRDITQRKEVERLKNEFVSMVSHELRTPLTSIRGALGLLSGNTTENLTGQTKALLDIANNNSIRLIHLINDILDLEKIEAGKMDFVFMPYEIMPVIEHTINLNKAYGQQFGVNFEIEEILDEAKVYIDKDRFIQILTNLLSNAAKFSRQNDIVKISASKKSNFIRISVSDKGSGIPEEFKKKIFEKFAQADSSDTRQKGGSGLGLSLCKAIIEKMGGTIGFTSEKDEGTTFFIDIPEYVENNSSINIEPTQASDFNVLICEDDRDVATIIASLLEQNGCLCTIAYNTIQAKQLLAQQQFDLITVDLILPDQNGISFIRELHKNNETNDIPIIVISIKANQGSNELKGDFAVIDWIDKPINEEKLYEAINRAKLYIPDKKPNILHIEDDLDVVHIVSTLFKDISNISSVSTIDEAKMKLKSETYDLVIIDVELPDGNGLDLIPTINNQDGLTPTIVFSASEISEAFTQQVDAFLLKSKTSNEKLLNTIKMLINSKSSKVIK